eukprot:3044071-Prymnesium_polylepis.1
MVSSCVICLGQSGKQLAGKRCTTSRCKAGYAARIKLAKAAAGGRGSSAATSPTASAGAARTLEEVELLVGLKLWE